MVSKSCGIAGSVIVMDDLKLSDMLLLLSFFIGTEESLLMPLDLAGWYACDVYPRLIYDKCLSLVIST